MNKKNVLVFVFDGFADWETSYAMVGIARSNRFRVSTLAAEKVPVRSMGGVTILPDLDFRPCDVDDLDPSNTAMLILPGGTAWEQGGNTKITELVRHCADAGIPVAAICGATLFLARLGLLEPCEHTSNDEAYLEAFAPGYPGRGNYRNQPAVAAKGVITAGGTAAVEFAQEIFDVLEIAEDQEVKAWFGYFQNKMVNC
jgi:putative intracellular protease/amidase